MSFAFDATVKGAAANSYITVASAITVLGGDLNATEFIATVTASQEKLLAMATQRLEQERYIGFPTTATQLLAWPRFSVPDQKYGSGVGLYCGAAVYSADLMPEPVLRAVCALAAAMAKNNALAGDTGLEGFTQVKVGPIDVTPRHEFRGGTLPSDVQRWLRGLRSSTESAIPVTR